VCQLAGANHRARRRHAPTPSSPRIRRPADILPSHHAQVFGRAAARGFEHAPGRGPIGIFRRAMPFSCFRSICRC